MKVVKFFAVLLFFIFILKSIVFSIESENEIENVMRVIRETIVYNDATENANKKAILKTGDIVTLINIEVNECDGYLWNKIKLSNGDEGYVHSENLENTTDYTEFKFDYQGKHYELRFNEKEYNIDLNNYPYYLIMENSDSKIALYYSKRRITSKKSTTNYICNFNCPFKVEINIDGTISTAVKNSNTDYYSKYNDINNYGFILSNQNIYDNNNKVFSKNHGYTYNPEEEKSETVNDIVRVTQNIKVYDGATIISDEKLELKKGDIITRIKRDVNERDGYVWDKIKLCNGDEYYIITEYLEETTDYTEFKFDYQGKHYELRFNEKEYNIDLNNYPYYLIMENSDSKVALYYSKERITTSKIDNNKTYYNCKFSNTLKIEIDINGIVTMIKKSNSYANSKDSMTENYGFILSNQNIYDNNNKVFSKNYGYTYNPEEEGETINDIVRVTQNIKVYDGATIISDEKLELKKGDIITRINRNVNERDGHIWDKIKLCNGDEYYIFTEYLEEATDYREFKFDYQGKHYDLKFNEKEYGIDLNNYPYYLIMENSNSKIALYYSKGRIIVSKKNYNNNIYYEYKFIEPLNVEININGTVTINKKSNSYINSKYNTTENYGFILTNQNIYDDKEKIFSKNHGYIYNPEEEKSETVNDIVRVTQNTKVYDGATIISDEKLELKKGDIITRIKRNVNERNGHTWDKIKLINGDEYYIITEYLEETTDYREFKFDYQGKHYDLRFNEKEYNFDLTTYNYYVMQAENNSISLYYSQSRITAKGYMKDNKKYYQYTFSGSGIFIVTIYLDGRVNCRKSTGNVSSTLDEETENYGYILSNQNIYDNKEKVFNKNHGYTYDISKETITEEEVVMRVNSSVIVYSSPSIVYDEIMKLPKEYLILQIKENINTCDGHRWNKVRLLNGTEGYVYADSLSISYEHESKIFNYKGKEYYIHLNPKLYGVNLNDYSNCMIFDVGARIY